MGLRLAQAEARRENGEEAIGMDEVGKKIRQRDQSQGQVVIRRDRAVFVTDAQVQRQLARPRSIQ